MHFFLQQQNGGEVNVEVHYNITGNIEVPISYDMLMDIIMVKQTNKKVQLERTKCCFSSPNRSFKTTLPAL